ncbi:hypothetical protein [Tateyamaria sp. ANG-S1]|uniref:hypothetical protein n=1 Tax=Tateyamaria sp. ANG-S1 TaxID=1577905 RepID=UPI00057E7854|nr:hypothetical protein [Tateyamaria sp. ANG-S1]KIC48037.1 hypothetical protein RA29_17725 [Tateyamaria sp. ANG-S1]
MIKMKNINFSDRASHPVLLALIAGIIIGMAPFFVQLAAPVAQAAHFLGAVSAVLAVNSLLRPHQSDWLGFVLFGIGLGLAPFFAAAALPFETVKWLMVIIGVTMTLAGFWKRWVTVNPPEESLGIDNAAGKMKQEAIEPS